MASKSRFLDTPSVSAFGSSNNSLTSTSASYAATATSASYAVTASHALFAVSASHEIVKEVSSSHANTADVAGGLQGQPSISVTNVTASSNISSSGTVTGLSGSFSELSGNSPLTVNGTVNFIDTVNISGSINVGGNSVVTSNQTGSFITGNQTGSYATTGSNNFIGNQTITGSVDVTGSLTVSGSGTFTNIGPFSQTGNSVFTGNITASANVSSSATSTASFGTYLGDGSQLSNISTTPFPFSGSAVITGSLVISGSNTISFGLPNAANRIAIGGSGNSFHIQHQGVGNPGLGDPIPAILIISGSGGTTGGNPAINIGSRSSTDATIGDETIVRFNFFTGGRLTTLVSGNGGNNFAFSVSGSSVNGNGGIISLGRGGTTPSNSAKIHLNGHLTASADVNISASATSTITSGFVTSTTSSHDYIQSVEGGGNIKIDGKDGGVSLHYTEDPDFSSIEIADGIKLNVSSDSASIDLSQSGIELRGPIKTYAITASVNVSSSATSTASFGTYLGDGSQLSGVSSTPFPFTGDAKISGSLEITGSFNSTRTNFLNNSTAGITNLVIGLGAGPILEAGGTNNTVIGVSAAEGLTTGDHNVIIGNKAGKRDTSTESKNVIIGSEAGEFADQTSGVLIGYQAGKYGSSGEGNIYLGQSAGMALSSDTSDGDYNVGIGVQALRKINDGIGNIALGANSGFEIDLGNYNITLGYYDRI